MLLVLITAIVNVLNVKFLISTESSPEASLRESMGEEDYFNVYDYSFLTFGYLSIVRYYDNLDFYKPLYEGAPSKRLSSIFNYVTGLRINSLNSNPNLAIDEGGNCHALSLIFKEVCLANSIDCKIEEDYGENHVYNLVTIDGTIYKVDLINQRMEVLDE